jgi:hypothetical protein
MAHGRYIHVVLVIHKRSSITIAPRILGSWFVVLSWIYLLGLPTLVLIHHLFRYEC